MSVKRFDVAKLQTAERTPQGYLRAPVYATRVGVFSYRLKDGTVRRELRHPDDVFAPESLASLASIPLTEEHPDTESGFIDASNTGDFMVGFTGESVARDGKFVSTSVTVTDASVIAKIEAGNDEVSCGYRSDIEDVAGEYEGEAYDVRQRNIRYNHLARVDRGRAGPDVRLRLDAADAVQVDDSTIPEKAKEKARMEKITLGGKEFEVSPELKAAIAAEIAGKDKAAADAEAEAKKELEVAKDEAACEEKRADRAEARADSLKEENRKLKADLATRTDAADPAKLREAVKARSRLEAIAKRTLTKDALAKLDSMDDAAIKREVIKAESKNVNLDGKSEAYVEARFDAIIESLGDEGASAGLGKEIAETRADADVPDSEKARAAAMERARNKWKGDAKK